MILKRESARHLIAPNLDDLFSSAEIPPLLCQQLGDPPTAKTTTARRALGYAQAVLPFPRGASPRSFGIADRRRRGDAVPNTVTTLSRFPNSAPT
jgi:hypothetical protein